MNTKGMKFLAVLAVLAMAFAVFAVAQETDAAATYYVDQADGDDEAAGTSEETAFKTFSKAITTAAVGDTILFVGDYDTNVEGASIDLKGKGVTLASADSSDISEISGAIKLTNDAYNTANTNLTGTFTFQNLNLVLTSMIGWEGSIDSGGADRSTQVNNVTFKFVDCDIESDLYDSTIRISDAGKMSLFVSGCTFTNTDDSNADMRAIALSSKLASSGSTAVIEDTDFNNYPRAAYVTNFASFSVDGGEVTPHATAKVNKASFQAAGAVQNMEVYIADVTLLDNPENKPFYTIHDSCNEASFKSFYVEGAVSTDDGATKAFSIAAGGVMTIPENGSLTVGIADKDWTMTVVGQLNVYGALIVNEPAQVDIAQNGKVYFAGTLTGAANVLNDGTITCSTATEASKLKDVVNDEHGTIYVEGQTKPVETDDDAVIADDAFDDADTVISTGAIETATVPADKALVVTNVTGLTSTEKVLTVKAANAELTVVAGADAKFSVDVGGTKKVEFTNFQGTATFTKGSIVINGEDFDADDITLHDGDVVKLSGIVGDVSFSYGDATGSAKIIVENDVELTLEGDLTIVGDKITLDIEGAVTGAHNIVNGGNVHILTGATVIGTSFTGAGKIDVFSGSDINAIGDVNVAKVTGRGLLTGTWKIDGTTLILDNYNGTYNFKTLLATVTTIKVTGENTITYEFAEDYVDAADWTFFGNAINSITTETSGTLTVEIDVSDIAQEQLFAAHTLTVLKTTGLTVNGVNIVIHVDGENAAWEDVSGTQIVGIDNTGVFTADYSSIVVGVMEKFKAENVVGINTGTITVDKAGLFTSISAGTGLAATGAVIIQNCELVTIAGEYAGIDADSTVALKSDGLAAIKNAEIEGKLTVMGSIAGFTGYVALGGAVDVVNASVLGFEGETAIEGAINVTQESVFSMKDGEILGTLTNGGNVEFTGNVVVTDTTGSIVNNSIMTNKGTLGIYGAFANSGTFNNEGYVEVYKYKFAAAGAITLDSEEAASAATNVKVNSITITAVEATAFGTAKVTANVVFRTNTAALPAMVFNGTLAVANDGSYVLTLNNGTDAVAATATIILSYNNSDPVINKFGKSFTIATTGTVKDGETPCYLENNATGDASKTITNGILATTLVASGANFVTNAKAIFNNEGAVSVSAATEAEGNIVKGTFKGDLTTNIPDVKISGNFEGNLTANGDGTVTITDKVVFTGNITTNAAVVVAGKVTGDITTEKGVASEGEIYGSITAKDSVTVNDILGNITVKANGPKNVTVTGAMLGSITYVSKYKATASATETTEYTAVMNVAGETTGTGFTVILAAGADATASAEVVPGFFKIDNGMAALETGKTVNLFLTEGKFLIDSITKLKTGYYLTVEAGTTIEVNKSAASLDVTEAALKVSKDATANFETGSETPVAYGKVLYIMSFEISGGEYTIYSDVAYALTNCDEGSELTVGSDAPINTSVVVPNGVNIIVDDVTLTFNGMDVKMGEGARITLVGDGKLVFNTSGNNLPVEEDEDYEYYSVTACIVYGDNELDFNEVRFSADNNTVVGAEATETSLEMIEVNLTYNEGVATITEGNAGGKLYLENTEYYPTKAAEAAEELKVTAAAFVVSENAAFNLEAFTDEMMDAELVAGDLKITAAPTVVSVSGILFVKTNIAVNGIVSAEGVIILDDDKTITVNPGEYLDVEKDIYFGAVFTGSVFDKRDSGFSIEGAAALPAGGALIPAGQTFAVKADKTNECIAFSGVMYDGNVEAISDSSVAMLNNLIIAGETELTAANAIISGDNEVYGLFKNVEMTKKTGATLAYTATYEDGEYTVYTVFANIDLDEVSDITLTEDLNIALLSETNKVDLSGKNLNITIAEGKKLIVDKILIIGTPITVLGDEGSSIVGKVVIEEGFYIVAYSDVDLTFAEIYGDDETTEAVFSKLDVEDMLYAVIFASNQGVADDNIILAKADAALIPEITGYNFTAWLNYNGDAKAEVGDTNAYADAKAIYLTITVKYVAGVDYYMNGTLFNVYDIPTDVPYGSYFTAKISDTTKYQGNPVINGQKTVFVDDNMELVASGVTPIPEPEPEPVIGDSGLSLTDILLIVLVVLIAIMVVILVLRLNRS